MRIPDRVLEHRSTLLGAFLRSRHDSRTPPKYVPVENLRVTWLNYASFNHIRCHRPHTERQSPTGTGRCHRGAMTLATVQGDLAHPPRCVRLTTRDDQSCTVARPIHRSGTLCAGLAASPRRRPALGASLQLQGLMTSHGRSTRLRRARVTLRPLGSPKVGKQFLRNCGT